MASKKLKLHCIFVLVLIPLVNLCSSSSQLESSSSTANSPTEEDVHDLLPRFGFPRGLIPSSVKEYSLSEDGEFEVHMDHSCYVQFDDLVYYDKRIKGHLTYGSISDLTGIQMKKLFLWVPVTGIDAASGYVQFHVGALSETFPAEQFENVRVCKSAAVSLMRQVVQPVQASSSS